MEKCDERNHGQKKNKKKTKKNKKKKTKKPRKHRNEIQKPSAWYALGLKNHINAKSTKIKLRSLIIKASQYSEESYPSQVDPALTLTHKPSC